MPEFRVHPDAVAEASLRLGTVEGGVTEILGRVGHHVGAAGGTPAAGALDDLLGHFSRVLPQFALAGAQLCRAVGGAANAYRTTDGALAEACEPATTGEAGVL